jgi:hypothetical protein
MSSRHGVFSQERFAKPAVVRNWTIASGCGEIWHTPSRWTLFQMKIGSIHGPVGEKDSGKQRNHQSRRKHLAGGFITDTSNGDDFEAIVSTGCQNILRRHSAAPLRLKFVQKT